jgi:hypothetical protein
VKDTSVIFRMAIATMGKSNETRKTTELVEGEGQDDGNEFEATGTFNF